MNRNRIVFLFIAIVLVTFIALIGNVFSTSLKKRMIDGVQNELISISKLKADNISVWYADELNDAHLIAQNKCFIEKISAYTNSNSSADSLILIQYIKSVIAEHGYSEILLVSEKFEVFALKKYNSRDLPYVLLSSLDELFNKKENTSTGLYHDSISDNIYIDFLSPLKIDGIIQKLAVVFRIDPLNFLYPLVKNLPLSSETAEDLIFLVENDSIVLLNDVRHLSKKALSIKIPLGNKNDVIVNAFTNSEKLHEGVDYRNVDVVAYVSAINGTPWYLLSKIDTSELYDRVEDQSRMFYLSLAFLLMLILALVAFLYSNSQKNVYKSLWLTQEEFKTTLYSIGDGVITTDSKGNVTHMNPIAEKLTGWIEEEALGRYIDKVFHIVNEVNSRKIETPVSIVLKKGDIVELDSHTLLISKQGKKVPISDSGAPILDNRGNITGVVLVFRDQTNEKQQHAIIEEQRRRLFTLMSNLPGMAYRCKNDEEWTMEFVSKGCLELTGYNDYDIEQNKMISYGKLIHNNYFKYVEAEVQKAISLKRSFEIQYVIIDRKGEEKWVWEKGQGIFNDNGEAIAIEGFINDISKLKEFESQFRQSENLFQTMAINLGVGIFKTDAKGFTTFVNPKYCEMTGLTEGEAMGLGWLKYIHPDDKQKINNNWANVILNKSEKVEDYRFVNSISGKIVWVSGRVTPELDNENNVLGYIGYITDITEMVKSEREISNKNLLINAVIQNIPDAVYMKDSEGRKLVANKADVENCGLNSVEDILGKNDFELFPENIAQKFWDDDQKVLKKGESIIDRLEKLENNLGETKWLYTSKIPLKDNEGEIIGMVGIGHDITRRKQDEDERIKLSTVVEQTPLSIMITDTEGNIEYVNPTFTKVSGYTHCEIIGKNPRILKSGKHDKDFYRKMWSTLKNGKVWSSEFQNRKKNGELYWEYVFITPIVNSSGELINYAAVREDITEKRQLHDELVNAKQKAEESDRLKTSFLANMSHEIRTPLNSILGFTSILEESDDLLKDERVEYQNIIRKSADSLLQIINDIIDISSLETGQLKTFVSSFDVNKMIKMLFREFQKRLIELDKSSIKLNVLVLDSEVLMNADQNRINQIFTNLLNNAVKFTFQGKIEFGIVEVDDKYIYFKVEDTGIGIPNEMHDAIFERFRQGEVKNNRNYGGNGLGLSIVRNLIHLMNGKIWVDSIEEKGSIFRFFIPINCDDKVNN